MPKAGFLKGVLETRFGSLESEKIGSLEQRNGVPTGPYRVPNILLKKKTAESH